MKKKSALMIFMLSSLFSLSCEQFAQNKEIQADNNSSNQVKQQKEVDEIEIKRIIDDFRNIFLKVEVKNIHLAIIEAEEKYQVKNPIISPTPTSPLIQNKEINSIRVKTASSLESAGMSIATFLKDYEWRIETESIENDKAIMLVKFTHKDANELFTFMRFKMLKQKEKWKISEIKTFDMGETPNKES